MIGQFETLDVEIVGSSKVENGSEPKSPKYLRLVASVASRPILP